MKTIVVLTGAGISAESGIKTFRESNGLWENHRVEDVATPEGWDKNPELVLKFYNERRKQIMEAFPNPAHLALVDLEAEFKVSIITQNIDDLHERAGSSNVMHLHGEIGKSQSTINPELTYDLKHWEMKIGDKCLLDSQLRPNIVWFGEPVPMIEEAIPIMREADIILVIGTSLAVYPAAGLINFAPSAAKKYFIDPNGIVGENVHNFILVKDKAGVGVPFIAEELIYKSAS